MLGSSWSQVRPALVPSISSRSWFLRPAAPAETTSEPAAPASKRRSRSGVVLERSAGERTDLGLHLDDPQARDVLGRVEPVRPQVRDDIRRPGPRRDRSASPRRGRGRRRTRSDRGRTSRHRGFPPRSRPACARRADTHERGSRLRQRGCARPPRPPCVRSPSSRPRAAFRRRRGAHARALREPVRRGDGSACRRGGRRRTRS